MATMEDLSRQRLDFEEEPDGSTTAILTVSLGDGTVHRYRANVTQEEYDQFGAAVAQAEARAMRVAGVGEDEIAGIFGDIAKGFKSVINGVKKVASSKVFKLAGRGLAMAAPALGPFAPAALAVSGGMEVAGNLARSAVAAEAGAKRAARTLTKVAHRKARVKTRGRKRSTRKLTSFGNRKRKNAFAAIARLSKRQRKGLMKLAAARRRRRSKKPIRRRKPVRRPNILAAAKRGRLRSNKKGPISPKQLRTAAKRGRVYWLAA